MSGGNQQSQTATVDPQQAQKEAADKAQQEKRDKENEQYERVAEEYRLFTGLTKSDWKRIDKLDEGENVAKAPSLSTADTSSGLIPPGVWRRGESPDHPATEFDVRVYEDGKVSACYKKRYQYGVLGWIKLLSDKEWDQAQGEVLDVVSAGRGINAVTLDWEQPEYVTETYIMRYLELAQARGLTVNFGTNVEKWLDNESQSVRDRVYQKRLAVEAHAKEVRSERETIGNEVHAFRQFTKMLQDPAKAPKLDDPQKLPVNTPESDESKKAAYRDKINEEMKNKSPQEKNDILQRELNNVEGRLKKADEAKQALEAQVKNIRAIGGDGNSPVDQKALALADNQLNKCKDSRQELLKEIDAETKDLKLRTEMLGRLMGEQVIASNTDVPARQQTTTRLEQRKNELDSEKTGLESKKTELETARDALIRQRADIDAAAVRTGQPVDMQAKDRINQALQQNKLAIDQNTRDIEVNKTNIETNKKEIEDHTKVVKSSESLTTANSKFATLNGRIRELETGKPGVNGSEPRLSIQQMKGPGEQYNHEQLQAVVTQAKGRAAQQAPAGPGGP